MTDWNELAAAALRQMAVPLVVTPSDVSSSQHAVSSGAAPTSGSAQRTSPEERA